MPLRNALKPRQSRAILIAGSIPLL
jgi:hypothetical protein